METNNNTNQGQEPNGRISTNSGRMIAGLILITVGSVFMAEKAGIIIPHWIISWPLILVGIGVFVGARHGFRAGGWLILVLLGVAFLVEDAFYDLEIRRYLWPAFFIVLGLFLILKPRGGRRKWDAGTLSSEDTLDLMSVFGGTKKNIISKNFKGGEITTVFGGTDLNFSQADINGVAVINLNMAFGGTKLVVPAHWNLRSEVVCIFGGIDDKRKLSEGVQDIGKTLVLKGNCVFGGIDIKSY